MHNLVVYVVYGAFDAFFKTLAILAALGITLTVAIGAWFAGKLAVKTVQRVVEYNSSGPEWVPSEPSNHAEA